MIPYTPYASVLWYLDRIFNFLVYSIEIHLLNPFFIIYLRMLSDLIYNGIKGSYSIVNLLFCIFVFHDPWINYHNILLVQAFPKFYYALNITTDVKNFYLLNKNKIVEIYTKFFIFPVILKAYKWKGKPEFGNVRTRIILWFSNFSSKIYFFKKILLTKIQFLTLFVFNLEHQIRKKTKTNQKHDEQFLYSDSSPWHDTGTTINKI